MVPLVSPSIRTALGTVWCVKESLWKEQIMEYGHSTREMHFGLSLLRMPHVLPSMDFIPMLHGRSEKSKGCFWAQGLSKRGGPDYKTYFGHLGPAQLPTNEIGIASLPHTASCDPAWAYDCLRIRPNGNKRELSEGEKQYLAKWLKRNRLC